MAFGAQLEVCSPWLIAPAARSEAVVEGTLAITSAMTTMTTATTERERKQIREAHTSFGHFEDLGLSEFDLVVEELWCVEVALCCSW